MPILIGRARYERGEWCVAFLTFTVLVFDDPFYLHEGSRAVRDSPA